MFEKDRVRAKWGFLIVAVGIFLLEASVTLAVLAPSILRFGEEASLESGIEYLYESPLTVMETITDIGGGSYRYEYSFSNTDTSPIWHFLVYTDFYPVEGTVGNFGEYPSWNNNLGTITHARPEYDARNLDPDISHVVSTYPETWADFDSGIEPGQAVSGFSFESGILDYSPKYYAYETLASGYADENGGLVAAVGQTVPEPTTLLLLGLGGLLLRKRR